MYSRAPRKLHDTPTATSSQVGPGYYAGDSRVRKPESATYAPFGTLKDRETLFAEAQLTKPVPSPNSYNHPSPTRTVGGSSLSNRSHRFGRDNTLAPAPGSYNVTTSLKGERRRPVLGASITRPPAASRIKFVRKTTASTIPARQETKGYVVGSDGSLTKAPPRISSPRDIGPGRYNVTDPDRHSATAKYKGVGWGRRTGRRVLPFEEEQKRKATPSPLDYTTTSSPAQAPSSTAHHIAGTSSPPHATSLRSVKPPFQTTAQRDVVATKPRTPKQTTPTPMTYSLPSSFSASKPPKPKHFGSTSRRFTEDKPRAPPPGAYNDPRIAIKVKQTASMTGLPFQQTAPRFEEPHPIRETPASIEYNVNVPPTNKSATSAFHSTARRTEPMFKRDTFMTPGPGDYQKEEDTTGKTFKSGEKQNYHAAFGMRAQRFSEPADLGAPPPTKYDVPSQDARKGPGKKTPQPAFRSKVARTQPITTPAMETPPPNAYNPSPPKRHTGGRLADHERERFRTVVSDAPPPTKYKPHPAVADSTFKRSFNVTLEHQQRQ